MQIRENCRRDGCSHCASGVEATCDAKSVHIDVAYRKDHNQRSLLNLTLRCCKMCNRIASAVERRLCIDEAAVQYVNV